MLPFLTLPIYKDCFKPLARIAADAIDYAMVKSINDIAQVMGKKTIAEYVENDAIMACLKEIKVDYGQGYGIGRPRPINEI